MSARKKLSFGAVVAGAVLVLSSAAFACTTYRGTFTTTGVNGDTETRTGDNIGMGYCPGTDTTGTVDLTATQSFTASVAKFVGTGSQKRCSAQLTDSITYDVNYQDGPIATGDCMTGQSGNQKVGIMDINADGSTTGGPQSYPQLGYSWTPTVGSASLCVSSPGAGTGNQVGISVI